MRDSCPSFSLDPVYRLWQEFGLVQGCLPFVRINRLGWPLYNGKGFSKISNPTERDGAYHLQFDFS